MKTITSIVLFIVLFGCNTSDNKYLRSAIEYPIHPVEVVIPFGGGGASDLFVRNFSKYLDDYYPLGITFSNIPGKGGIYAVRNVMRKPADGYTLLEITPSVIISDILHVNRQDLLRDNFIPIARIQTDNYVVSVKSESPYDSFEELIKNNKGKVVYVSGLSSGGLDSITTHLLSKTTGVNFKLVPYRSGAEAKAGIVSGETQVYIDKVISASKLIKNNIVKPLLVIADKEHSAGELLKGVPLSSEIGLNIPILSWRAFAVRKETPADIIRYIATSMRRTTVSEAYVKDFPLAETDFMENGELDYFIKSQYVLFEKIISDVN